MIEFGALLTVAGLTASVLAPICLIYVLIHFRRDLDRRPRPLVALGVLATVQTIASMIYFAMMWQEMSRTGLGV